MRRINSSVVVDFISEKGVDKTNKTYFAYVPLEDMACYAVAESYDDDYDINSAELAVESVLVAFERNPSFWRIKSYIDYAHDQLVANSVKNRLETAITVVVTDYTRIRYASCGNIKLYLISDNAFYLKSETQTYYQYVADEYGLEKAERADDKNLTQYLGKKKRPKPYVSKKINLLEESTMLFASCCAWERVDDVEVLDAYEESEPDKLLGNLQELLLLSQLQNPAIGSYALASLFVEKTFKEDTNKKKKRRRFIMIAAIILLILIIVVAILRAIDKRAMLEIEGLDDEGLRYSNLGNYSAAFEQYDKAKEQAGKLRMDLQYVIAKRNLKNKISERWHFFSSIKQGDEYLDEGKYREARDVYREAQRAYYDLREKSDTYSALMVDDVLDGKLDLIELYVAADDLIKDGERNEAMGNYAEAQARYKEADKLVKLIGDLDLRRDLLALIFEVGGNITESAEESLIKVFRASMEEAEGNQDYQSALQFCDSIINTYQSLGITDSKSLEDKKRIQDKMKKSNDAEIRIEEARAAVIGGRLEDAIGLYEMALGLYDGMGIDEYSEKYMSIKNEVSSTKALLDTAEEEAAAAKEAAEKEAAAKEAAEKEAAAKAAAEAAAAERESPIE